MKTHPGKYVESGREGTCPGAGRPLSETKAVVNERGRNGGSKDEAKQADKWSAWEVKGFGDRPNEGSTERGIRREFQVSA